eukprot:TRINITY_DN21305_c0_g1_i3.p1 TRINITY_DN21305_c0_g1~~TRINITY_DN21305_c0_g1_i3.p1  ORF type:complete len:388 (+),score=56.30 TRINITY_DN21305_c0_g1_i3:569-1732(+)
MEFANLLACAGDLETAVEVLSQIEEHTPGNRVVLQERGSLLAQLGRGREIDALAQYVSKLYSDPEDFSIEREISRHLSTCKAESSLVPSDISSHRRVVNYAVWQLRNIRRVSKHSAVYQFTSDDPLRGAASHTGRRGTEWKTWHTTMLAEVGQNREGPLPWIERDYTPVSTAEDWEEGRCDMLIKIYKTGQATSWLAGQPLGSKLWLSKPMKTLDVPSLVPNRKQASFKPRSALLVVAGTGIAVATQVLQYTHQATRRAQGLDPIIKYPVSLMYSCRADDILMSSEILEWCKQADVLRCTITVTEVNDEASPPFPNVKSINLQTLQEEPKFVLKESRVTAALLQENLSILPGPCRVLVSGPEAFNAAVRGMLQELDVQPEAVTILSA